MKKLLISACFLLVTFQLDAQFFEAGDTLRLEENTATDIKWADWQGNQSPDLIITSQSEDGFNLLLAEFKNSAWSIGRIPVILRQQVYEVADMNNDGLLDIIGIMEVSGINTLAIARQLADSVDILSLEPLDSIRALSVAHFDRDGFRDIAVSGYHEGTRINHIYTLSETGIRDRDDIFPDSSFNHIIHGHFETPGKMNFVFTGELGIMQAYMDSTALVTKPVNANNVMTAAVADIVPDNVYEFIYSNADGDIILPLPNKDSVLFNTSQASRLFSADFNSDGITDIWADGPGGQHIMYRGDSTGFSSEYTLPVVGSRISFGDMDLDGDLDLAAVSRENASLIHLFTNVADTNRGPSIVSTHVAFQVGDKVVFAWIDPADDHTAANHLTYDLIIGDRYINSTELSGGFDLDSARRMSFVPGNVGVTDNYEFEGLEPGIYFYGLQGLDNSLFPYFPAPGDGTPGDCQLPCPIALGTFEVTDKEPEVTRVPICGQEYVTLGSYIPSAWYSSEDKFLGFDLQVTVPAVPGTRIYQQPVIVDHCNPQLNRPLVYELVEEELISTSTTLFACEGDTILTTVSPRGDSTRWTGNLISFTGEGPSLYYPVSEDQYFVARTFFNGCVKTDTFHIKISRPDLTASPASVVVFKGNAVQLNASGAETYRWDPADYLDDQLIADPVSTPPQSIIYTVIGRDSIQCADSAFVTIEVQDQAFIPNLFTPNDDNHNDRLLIYGLSPVSTFKFTIYNRNGAEIYSTTDPSELTVSGWDGSRSGNPQPDGVYYWKVEGTFSNNDPVLLNGKNEGVVHLMR